VCAIISLGNQKLHRCRRNEIKSRRVIFIGLVVCILAGVLIALAVHQQGTPADVAEPEEPEEAEEPTTSEPSTPEIMTVGDFISKLVVEEYEKSMEGKEPTIRQGTLVRVLGRVEGFRAGGEHPYFRGEVDLKPYYCSRRVQCIFRGEAVAQLQNLEQEMDVIIEGKYGGIDCFRLSHDICRLLDCSLISIESPRIWTVPTDEEIIGGTMRAEYLVNVQSNFRKGDIVRICGLVYSVTVEWSYLEGMWGDLLVSRRGESGAECEFEGKELLEVMKLPERQEVVIEGAYSHGSASRAFLTGCSLVHP